MASGDVHGGMMTQRYVALFNISHGNRLYARGRVLELEADAAKKLTSIGAVRPADSQPDEPSTDGGEGTQEIPEPPAQSEPKAAFVDYAVTHLGVDRAEAEEMNKADLVELTRE